MLNAQFFSVKHMLTLADDIAMWRLNEHIGFSRYLYGICISAHLYNLVMVIN